MRITTVSLTVSDLARSLAFYTQTLGFGVLRSGAGTALLGAGDTPLLELIELPGAPPKPQHATGLYHFALLVPNRPALARSLRQIAESRYPLDGLSDHGVSEAIYLSDPDENGIEVYADRPRAQWPLSGGALRMITEPLNLDSLLAELSDAPWTGLEPGTSMGHIHLHVPQLDEAIGFYTDALGMQLMQRYGHAAAFMSWNGYHHHVGLNTWAGVGAPPAPLGSVGLRWFALTPPPEAGITAAELTDPAGHQIILQS